MAISPWLRWCRRPATRKNSRPPPKRPLPLPLLQPLPPPRVWRPAPKAPRPAQPVLLPAERLVAHLLRAERLPPPRRRSPTRSEGALKPPRSLSSLRRRRYAAFRRPRQSWRTLRRQPPQYRFHGGGADRQTPRHCAVAAEILGAGGGRRDRRRQTSVAAARHLHERVRPCGGGSHEFLQARRVRHRRVSRRARTAARQAAGEGRRRQCRS